MTPELQATTIRNYFHKVYGTLRPPATEKQVEAVETTLGCRLPPTLRDLYLLCDGIEYPEGDSPLIWVQMIPRSTEEFLEFAPEFRSERYICFGWVEGLRHLAIEIQSGRVVSFDPSLRDDFVPLGSDLLTAYKNLEKWNAHALQKKLPPDEFWQAL